MHVSMVLLILLGTPSALFLGAIGWHCGLECYEWLSGRYWEWQEARDPVRGVFGLEQE